MSNEPLKRPDSDLHTILIAAIIPLIQSLLTGLVIGSLVFALALHFDAEKPWAWGLWGFLLSGSGMWIFSIQRWYKLTDWLPTVERMTNLDINRDGRIGDRLPSVDVVPDPKQITVTVRDVHDQGHLSVMRYDLPVDEAQLGAFAVGVGQGVSLAEANWIGPSNPFTRDEYRAFRKELIRRRWIELANHKSAKQGFQMTEAGRAVMREIAKTYGDHSPTPDESA